VSVGFCERTVSVVITFNQKEKHISLDGINITHMHLSRLYAKLKAVYDIICQSHYLTLY
jgi:hypothetical protein